MSHPASALRTLAQEPSQNLPALRQLSALTAANLPKHPSTITNIVVVGLRGVGKSTLALMASADLSYTYVDTENCVSSHTGMPDAVYLKSVSMETYQDLQFRLIKAKIAEYADESKIIVMPSTAVNSPQLRQFLTSKEFQFIINVECEEKRILQYMNFEGTDDEGVALVRRKFDAFREISTHDYFNCFSNAPHTAAISISVGAANVDYNNSFFVLKPAQKDFTKFLTFLTNGADAAMAVSGNLHLRSSMYNNYSNCLEVVVPSDSPITNDDLMGVDFLELKIDMIRLIKSSLAPSLCEIFSQYRRLSNSAIPIIVSIRLSPTDAQSFIQEYSAKSAQDPEMVRSALKDYYLSLLGSLMRLGSSYLCLNLDIFTDSKNSIFFESADKPLRDVMLPIFRLFTERCGNTEVIATCDFEDPSLWTGKVYEVLELAHSLDIRIVRLSSVASRLSDSSRLISFREAASQRQEFTGTTICAYDKGPLGKLSKITNQMFTPVVPQAALNDSNFTAFSLTQTLSNMNLLPKLQFYIMGANVAELASPHLHGETYKVMGLPYKYELFECDRLMPHLANLVKSPNFGGAAIIMPFKLDALQYVDSMSNHVKVIGALNTIIPQRKFDKPDEVLSIRGENTDWLGVRIALQDNTSPFNSSLKDKTALIMGAGGMARSAIYALIQLGYSNILLYNRTKSRAHELAEHFNSLSPLLPSRSLTTGRMCDSQRELKYFRVIVLEDADFNSGTLPKAVSNYPVSIVSCVPSIQRETGKAINFFIHENWFSSASGGVVLETGYKPLYSAILERGLEFSSKGWNAVNGLNWLLAQAIAQFEMFTNKQAPVAFMKQVVCSLYDNENDGHDNGWVDIKRDVK